MKEKKRIIVIGGSAAGPKATAKARRLDEMPRSSSYRSRRTCQWPRAAIRTM